MTTATDDFAGIRGERELINSRVFAAPRARVWQAWLDPAQLSQWWGPNGFTTTTNELDLRVGGRWRHTMHGPDGATFPNDSTFTEVIPMERIATTMTGGRSDGRRVNMERIMTWEDVPDGTRFTIEMTFATQEERDFVVEVHGAIRASHEMHARLAALLAKEKQ